MNKIKSIRMRLGVTQSSFAEGINMTQGNVSHYEKGQTVPPEVAARVIGFAKTLGVSLSFNDIYESPQPHHPTQVD